MGLIELQKYELCFSCVKMAEKYKVTDYFLRRFLDKLAKHNILIKKKRKIETSNSHTVCHTVSRTVCRTSNSVANTQFYTSITFYGWVFGGNLEIQHKASVNDQKIGPSVEPFVKPFVAHNIEVIKEEEKKEEYFYTHNACENKNGFQKASEIPGKTWYPIEQIASLEFPNAQRILAAWQKFSGQTNIQIAPLLRQYCKEQKDIDIHQMTLDILDFRFRKYMKQHFKIKKQVEEPVRRINYL